MNYRVLVAVVAVLVFVGFAALNLPGALEAGSNTDASFDYDNYLTFYVPEDSDIGHEAGDIDADDPDDDTLYFRVSGGYPRVVDINEATGVVTTNRKFDYEEDSEYTLWVSVRDKKDSNGNPDNRDDATVQVIIEITNVDEDGTVSFDWSKPQVGTVITASITDIDGGVTGETWQWARCTSKTDSDCSNIAGATNAAHTPVDDDNEKFLRATVSYTDTEGPSKSASGFTTYKVREAPTGTNTAPTFDDGTSTTRNVRENRPPGWNIDDPVVATDGDSHDENDYIRYSLGGTHGSHFSIEPLTGQLKVKGPLDRETKDTYTVTVTAEDPSEASTDISVTITITDQDEKPVVTPSRVRVNFPEDSATLEVTKIHAYDPEGKNMGFVIGALSTEDGSQFRVNERNGSACDGIRPSDKPVGTCGVISFESSPDFEMPGSDDGDNFYSFSVTAYVTDATHHSNTVYAYINVTVTNGEDGPTVIGPSEVEYLETRTDAVANYGITMQGGGNITVTLTGDDAGDFRYLASTGNLEFRSQPAYASPADADENNVYLVTLNATSGNLTTVRNVEVTVLDYNYPPVVSGPTTKNVAENTTAVGTYTYTDADQDSVTWTLGGDDAGDFLISGSGELTFDPAPDFETPADDDTSNDYEVTIQADDGTNALVEYPVTVTVTNVNEAPEFPGATATRNVDENTAADQDIGAAVEASDVDANDTLTYSLDAAGAAVFGIDTTTGQLKTKAALDHEDTDSYTVTVTVRDAAGLTASVDVTITVNDVNDAPAFDSETATRDIAENTVAGTDIGDAFTASDEDEDTLAYSLDTASALVFDIDTDGQLKTKAALDHETTDSYEVTISVTDNLDAQGNSDTVTDDTIMVTVNVTDVNEAPAFLATETGARSIAENTAAGQNIGDPVAAEDPDAGDTLTYSLGGTDASSFNFDTSTGQIKTKDALDFEAKDSYDVTVSVRDSKDVDGNADMAVDATKDVIITVTDENENIDLSGDQAPEYAENGTGNVATYTATDRDGGTIIWNLSGEDAGLFDLTGGVLTFDSSPDYEMPGGQGGDNKYQVTVEASTSNDIPATLPVTVTVTDVNEAPAFPSSEDGAREIPEGTPAGQDIGDAVTAFDQDNGETLTYSLTGTDASAFDIDTSTGQIKTKDALDHGTKASYSVTVSVRDSRDANGDADTDADATQDVTITVLESNDTVTLSGPVAVDYAENGTGDVAEYTATDQEGQSITWDLSGDDESLFEISSTGVLTFASPPDFEFPEDVRGDNQYQVIIEADDTTGTPARLAVTVSVTDVEEIGTVTLFPRQPQVGQAFTASLWAPDLGSSTPTWAWEKSTDKVTWAAISTATAAAYTPVAGDVGSYLRATASYSAGKGNESKSASGVSEFQVRAAPGANSAPAFAQQTDTREIREDAVVGTNVGVPVTATDTDTGDNDKLTYTLGGTDLESFDIDEATGQIKTAITLDYDTKSSYTVTVTATDPSLATDSVVVTINVTQAPATQSNSGNNGGGGGGGNGGGGGGSFNHNSNSRSQFTKRGSEHRSVPENTTSGINIGQPLTATDAENDTLTYSLAGTDAASFDIDTATGQLKTKELLDHETKSSYTVTVSVHDGMNDAGGSDTTADDTVTVNITVTDVNEPPEFNGQTAIREVAENTVAGQNIGDPVAATDQDTGDTLTYTLGGTDASAFAIDATGQLKTKAPLDYESKSSYTLTVSVRDSKNDDGHADTLQDDSIGVTITVIDLTEVATLTLSSSQPQVGTPLTATLHDPDGASNETWAWEKSSDGTNWTTISSATSSSYTPVAADVNYYLRVTVIYTDSNSSNKSAQAISQFAVRAEPSETNTGPDFGAKTANRSIVEGSVAGRNIGQPVTATDANVADAGKLTYGLSGTDGGSFNIVASSGQLLTKDPLVYATKSTYTVTVTARDPFHASDTITVTITVTEYVPPQQTRSISGGASVKPTNPEPEFDENGPVTFTVAENTAPGTNIGDALTATDADDTNLTYSIVDWRDGSSFDIDSGTGQLKTKAPLDYETRTQYQLQARVHDDDGGDDRITVNIRVTGVPEAPSITGDAAIQVAENTTGTLATYTATDPEGQDVSWDLSGDDAGDFSIANGALRFRSSPDHDNPADDDGDNVYNVTVEASDGTDTGTLDVTVTVTNLVDDFRVRGATRGTDTSSNSGTAGSSTFLTAMSYPENSTATVATYGAIESDGSEINWTVAGDDGDLFSIEDGGLNFDESPDYEAPADSDQDNSYSVKVQATDGAETVSLDITINVTNVNEAPSVSGEAAPAYDEQGTGSISTYTGSDPEGDDLSWSVSGDDDDEFSISGGVLSFAERPNYEGPSDTGSNNVYDVRVTVSDGTFTDSLDVSVTVNDIQEVPITNASTQTVALVNANGATTVKTPDDVASVTFPSGSRSGAYFVRVDSDSANCSADSNDETTDPSDDNLRICLTVEIFDTWGTQENDVTLSQAATIAMVLDADDLGGADIVQQAYDADGFAIYTRGSASDDWSAVDFSLSVDDDDGVNITITGITSFSSFAASTDDDVFERLINPPATPTPTPAPELPSQGIPPTSMVAPYGRLRIPPRPSGPSMVQPAASGSDDTPDAGPLVSEAASVAPLAPELVEKVRWWALIVLIIGSIMFATGSGLIAIPRILAPPKWMRVPGAPPTKKAPKLKPITAR